MQNLSASLPCTVDTCIGKKVIRAMLLIGIAGQESRFAKSHWMRNGSASQGICWSRIRLHGYQTVPYT